MSKLIFTVLCLVFSFNVFSQVTGDTVISNNQAKLKLKVLYFHTTERCHTCYSIEENLRKMLSDNFKTQLDQGIIDLYILNCEIPENLKLVEKYSAYGSTLAITPYKKGVEITSEDLSNWAFQKVNKPEIFKSELINKISVLLK